MKKVVMAAFAASMMLTYPSLVAAEPAPGAAVNNPNANANACWGQDRSFYASGAAREDIGWTNLDIKQSFPKANGKQNEQLKAWIATYCAPHGKPE